MGYKKSIFNDKTIVIASAVGLITIAAIAGGIFLGMGGDEEPKGNIVDLDEQASIDYYQEMESPSDEQVADNNQSDEDMSDIEDATDDTKVSDISDNNSETEESTSISDEQIAQNEQDEQVQDANVSEGIVGMNFSPSSVLIWPVEGNILIDFDMKNTVYFATLDLYKCSDAVCIQSAVDTPVYAASACSVDKIDYNSEIGNNVTVSLGNGYTLTYGQLKDVQIATGDVLEEGDLIGYIGHPTKYYNVEGPNLYMKMTLNGVPVDPLDYLDYE
ncbi:MAG: peptidoglycan DD-metalloendopeptidase family protein [Lachnospiraceae bacterium]|nr:peptidoglycan DD-metalloendopeptidase family protein [Lachnospiraceae bacterium]